MLSALLDTVLGAALQLLLLVVGLLPTIDVMSLPIAPPEPVQDALHALNWIVPIGDLIGILTVWIAAVLAVNVAMVVYQAVQMARR